MALTYSNGFTYLQFRVLHDLRALRQVVIASLLMSIEYHKANDTRGTPEMWGTDRGGDSLASANHLGGPSS
jgi:hypothetical protein